jgi:hypothetical protein
LEIHLAGHVQADNAGAPHLIGARGSPMPMMWALTRT